MVNFDAYNTAVAALASAGVAVLAAAFLWYVVMDVKGAWKTVHDGEGRRQLLAAAERRQAERVIRRAAKKHGKIEKLETNGELVFYALSELPQEPWPPIKMRPAMPEERRDLLSRCLAPCDKTAGPGNGLRMYAAATQLKPINTTTQ